MLNRLYVKNIALIQEANIEFDKKFNVLSGETGSGKSIILDSINFVLGSKADKNLIRYGADEAFVRAEFTVEPDSAAIAELEEMDIECDGTIVISRKYSHEGKGSIKINGNSVSVSMLRKVTAHLVDVHGQSEHFYLLNEKNQLSLIDGLCKSELKSVKAELSDLITKKRAIRRQIDELGGDEQERARKLDLLDYQIKEIESAEIRVGEYEELLARKKVMDNLEKIALALSEVRSILSDDNGCTDLLSSASRIMSSVSGYGDEYSSISDRIENISVEAEDISQTISDLSDGLSFDEGQAQYIEERLTLLKNLMRKYGNSEEAVLSYFEDASRQYEALSDAAENIERLQKSAIFTDDKIYDCCRKLSEMRKSACESFTRQVVAELKSLNIPNAKFEVEFAPFDRQTARLSDTNGSDDVSFMFSANKGEPLKPLSKIISGGEMSRFMLSVKTQLKDINGISTYIFDEIDAGISGVTARAVAEKFVAISHNTQIIAVSHLPQVCAAASCQFLISKTDDGRTTVTNIRRLNHEERMQEIVRLTGSQPSEAAKKHANELLAFFGN